jgi:hypothetical protein
MSTKPKFDPTRVADLLSRGAEEGRGPLSPAPAPLLESVPAPTFEAPALEVVASEATAAPPPARSERPKRARRAAEVEPAEALLKRPITVRLSEEVVHALVRYQAEVRCRPGVRLGETTIGGVMDKLLRAPLGLA